MVSIGQSTELILFLLPKMHLTDIQWTQVDGPSVEFYAKNTKVISFTPHRERKLLVSGAIQNRWLNPVHYPILSMLERYIGSNSPAWVMPLLEENAVSLVSFAAG